MAERAESALRRHTPLSVDLVARFGGMGTGASPTAHGLQRSAMLAHADE